MIGLIYSALLEVVSLRRLMTSRRLLTFSKLIAIGNKLNLGLCALSTAPTPKLITKEELKAELKSGNLLLIDVREPKEIAESGSFPAAKNIPCTICLLFL